MQLAEGEMVPLSCSLIPPSLGRAFNLPGFEGVLLQPLAQVPAPAPAPAAPWERAQQQPAHSSRSTKDGVSERNHEDKDQGQQKHKQGDKKRPHAAEQIQPHADSAGPVSGTSRPSGQLQQLQSQEPQQAGPNQPEPTTTSQGGQQGSISQMPYNMAWGTQQHWGLGTGDAQQQRAEQEQQQQQQQQQIAGMMAAAAAAAQAVYSSSLQQQYQQQQQGPQQSASMMSGQGPTMSFGNPYGNYPYLGELMSFVCLAACLLGAAVRCMVLAVAITQSHTHTHTHTRLHAQAPTCPPPWTMQARTCTAPAACKPWPAACKR